MSDLLFYTLLLLEDRVQDDLSFQRIIQKNQYSKYMLLVIIWNDNYLILNIENTQMTDISNDPLRFLNIKRKREINKQKVLRSASNKQKGEQTSHFVMPTFSSQNSLENEEVIKFKKTYNPMKYFNPQIQEYLCKMKLVKIANSPIMPSPINNLPNSNALKYFSSDAVRKDQMVKQSTLNILPTAENLKNLNQMNNQIKQKYNFCKPGLKKSGSMKMMEKIQQAIPPLQQREERKNKNGGISPWELPQNGQQVQLMQCEICGRKFNEKSYYIHIKICEKVFFQKRKPFNSRSKSKQKK